MVARLSVQISPGIGLRWHAQGQEVPLTHLWFACTLPIWSDIACMICSLRCTNRRGGRCVVWLSSSGCCICQPRLWAWKPLPSLSSAAWQRLIIQFASDMWQPVGSQIFVWGHQPVTSRVEEGIDLLQRGFVCLCIPHRLVIVEHPPPSALLSGVQLSGLLGTRWCFHTGNVSIV